MTYIGEGTLDPSEQGWKDTIRVAGQADDEGEPVVGELVSIIGQFGGASGRYVYHCHILEHEDEGMMSTFVVMPEEVMAVDPHTGSGHHTSPGRPRYGMTTHGTSAHVATQHRQANHDDGAMPRGDAAGDAERGLRPTRSNRCGSSSKL